MSKVSITLNTQYPLSLLSYAVEELCEMRYKTMYLIIYVYYDDIVNIINYNVLSKFTSMIVLHSEVYYG